METRLRKRKVTRRNKMSISGKTVHSGIKSVISDVENEHNRLSKELYNDENTITQLSEERENSYFTLATTYLPEMTSEAIKNSLKEVQREVKEIFQIRQRRRQELENLMGSSRTNKIQFETRLEEVTKQLEEKAARRDEIKGIIARELDENKEYITLHSEAQKADAQLKQNKKRHEAVKNESEKKLSEYEKNELFMYLLRRNYGTKKQIGNSLTMRLDDFVAGIVNYKEQLYKNYMPLKETPGLINEEIEKRQTEINAIVEKLKTFEDASARNHGLPKILEEGIEISKTRSEVISEIEKLDADSKKYSAERSELDNIKGEYHKRAIKKLKEYLKGHDIAELKKLARSTPGTEDDKLVGRIEDIDKEIRNRKDKAKEVKKQQNDIATRLDDLRDIQNTYTRKDYESSRSYFDSGFDINSFLIGYLSGSYSAGDVKGHIEQHQHFESVQTYTPTYSYSSPSPSHTPSDSGFSLGGMGDAGGISDGGGFGDAGGF